MAAKQNIVIEQGATFQLPLTLRGSNKRPINLTGHTAKLQIRESHASLDVLMELSTTNGKITITPASGRIDIVITDEETSAITWKTAVYDLVLYAPDGTARRLIEGKVTVSEGVTRAA